MSGCLGLGVKTMIDCKWAQGSFWGDGNGQKLGCGDGHTAQ